MRILALVPGGIGDQILFFPTLADLHQKYPDASIDVIAEPRAIAAYRVCPYVRAVPFDFKGRNSLADFVNLLGIIRDREYEVALALGQRWTVGLLLWLNGIPNRIGYATNPSWFLTNPVPLKNEQYAAYMYHDLLRGLDIATPCKPPELVLAKTDITWAENEQQRLGLGDGYILVHGGSSRLAIAKGIDKIYPVEKWQQVLADIRTKQPDLPIVVLQGPEDTEFVAEIAQTVPNLKVTSPPDIGKLAAFIGGANLMLCTDSAPMHLAVAVGTYTIALFGPTQAAKLLPPESKTCVGIQSPSDRIADIPVDAILKAIWGN
ncbi:ADP-heptose:LPS heptosyltransferase [Rubidibacter lacunae KORDI 51-2]|uniref:ADP-heptose:LPS heptosyltransferase n=1 Tax=Rubidibacter lacunae KORDI 51-2 TaxID=582515 RepID=U5D5X1_9CHRO|nr:glycosyltransferase family 9 protein [Rubidibacter lacunae]ERN40053.1 ADP-heptose:LPS heptosyltransferase [Rubidibacter lacunae KORDI 51-2]